MEDTESIEGMEDQAKWLTQGEIQTLAEKIQKERKIAFKMIESKPAYWESALQEQELALSVALARRSIAGMLPAGGE